MKVIAFSCAHWMSREVQEEIFEYEPLDYKPFITLCKQLLWNPPDIVIDLGDLFEAFYETILLPDEYMRLAGWPRFHKLRGNHDPQDGKEFIVIDDVRYEHGHKFGSRTESLEEYVTDVRLATQGLNLVHGHTHIPNDGMPLDVGSVTFSRTYGEIIDGIPHLRQI